MTEQQQNHRKNSPSRARAIAAATAATAAAILGAVAPSAYGQLKINEAFIDAPGINSTQDFIELSGTPNTTVNNVWLLFVEGDTGAPGGVGPVDHAVQLGNVTTGSNGLWIRHSFSTVPTFDPATTVTSGAFQPTNPQHENTAITWMLVTDWTGTPTSGTTVNTDIDTNDDGVVDSTPWTSVLDTVGLVDGNSVTDKLYASPYGGAEFNQNSFTDVNSAVVRDANGVMHAVAFNSSPNPPVGGPYPVNSGFTLENGYALTPGSANTNPASNPQAFRGAAGSSWNTGTNWSGGVAPTAAGSVAMFDLTSGAASLDVTADATVGVMSFTNGGNRSINAGGGTLTIQGATGVNAQVMVHFGNVTIDAPVKLGGTTNFRPARGTTLTLSNFDANGQSFNKNSIGHLAITSPTPGHSLNIATLNISSGSVGFPSDGSKNRVMKVNSLIIGATTSRIDLADNKLITNTPVGTLAAGVYTDVSGMIQKGANFGAWNGQGIAINSSAAAAAAGLTAIGVASGEQILGLGPTDTALFAGQTITGASTVVMYTYAGDANLDGFISGDDYAAIDLNVAIPGSSGWYNGDFNWDGLISGDDYAAIDLNIALQGAPFPTGATAGLSGVNAVPEPASLGVVGVAAAALLGRRRSRRRG